MKITIPSRIGIPTAPPGEYPSPAAPGALGAPASSTSSSSRPTIKIKQQQPALNSSAGYPSPQLTGQSYTQAQAIASGSNPAVKTEDNNVAGTAAGGLSLPDKNGPNNKRKRSSLTPSGVAANGSTVTATPEQIAAIQETLVQLFDSLRDFRKDGRIVSPAFMHLPPMHDFPDYYATIKKPISFAEIKTKLDRKMYTSLKQLADDFHQMFVNAKRYNQKGSVIFDDAKRLDKHLKITYTQLSGGLSFDGFGGPAPDTATGAPGTAGSGEDGALGSAPLPTTSTSHLPLSSTSATSKDPTKKPKRKHRKGAGAAAAQAAAQAKEDDKPMTLTRWLTGKVDDLMAMRDQYGRTLSDIFIVLPPQDQYPDYYRLIQRPVCFQLVRSRLKNRNYPTIQKFIDDVNAIFTNAQYYNEEGSQVWQDAKVLQDHFAELMKEPAPEFHVRPRNKDQQAVAGNGNDSNNVRLSIGGSAANADGSQITLQMGQNGGIENIAFAEEWDDEGPIAEDEEEQGMDIDNVGKEESRSPVPPSVAQTAPHFKSIQGQATPGSAGLSLSSGGLPNRQPSQQPPLSAVSPSAPSPALQAPTKPSAPTGMSYPSKTSAAPSKTRTLSRIAVGQTPYIRSFVVSFVSSSNPSTSASQQMLLLNTTVRQHSIVCPNDFDRIDILPVLSSSQAAAQANASHLAIAMRPQHTVADAPVGPEEAKGGIGKTKWLTRPMNGLNVIEISTTDGKEIYRIFVNKDSA